MRLIITGSRNFTDTTTLRGVLKRVVTGMAEPGHQVTLVSGACPTGADRLAEEFWSELGWPIERHPADWDQHGKRAGFVRNARMAELGADVCVAFPLGDSRGTRMMMELAQKAGINVVSVTAGGSV